MLIDLANTYIDYVRYKEYIRIKEKKLEFAPS